MLVKLREIASEEGVANRTIEVNQELEKLHNDEGLIDKEGANHKYYLLF